jgi:MarR family 2-MHQ and catechol resistance regulon transcriptional repressor
MQESESTRGVHVFLVLAKAFRSVAMLAEASLAGTGLGGSDFRVLEILLHKGPLPVNTLGPRVNLTPGSISVAVDRLETKGLVARKGDPGDRRVRIVELTAKGRDLIGPIFRAHAADMDEAVAVLSEVERQVLVKLLKKLGKSAEAAR